MYIFGMGRVGGVGVSGFGVVFTNPGGTRGVWGVCLCLGCGGVGGVVGEWMAW